MSTELDNDFIPDREYPFRETLRWWERRRVWYNLVIVSMQALMIWDFWEAVLFVGFEYTIVLSLL
ncbi:hypothetical protein N9355_08490 [Crocinitomicaceae bacterium]|nr:hypothetical protein [Crocinitomicaceae bacterium]